MKSIKNQKSKIKRFGTLFRGGWVNGRLALFLAVCGLAVASCGHIRYIPVAGETIIKDSIIYEERIDTAWITLPPVKVKDYSALKDTLRLDGVYEVAWAAVSEEKEMLVGGIETTKEKIPTQVIYKTKTEYRDSTVYKEIPIEIEKERIVKVYPKGLVILSIFGTISILVLLFILYIKIRRKLSPIG
jgi:hypothetical protein